MGREKEDFRDNLARICERFTGELITLKEASEYIGVSLRNIQADKTFPAKKVGGRYYVTVVALARWLS